MTGVIDRITQNFYSIVFHRVLRRAATVLVYPDNGKLTADLELLLYALQF